MIKNTKPSKALVKTAVSTRFIYDCGIKYAYELAKKENAELNVDTVMMIAKDYTKHVVNYLSQNEC